jgi:hypothetical protein
VACGRFRTGVIRGRWRIGGFRDSGRASEIRGGGFRGGGGRGGPSVAASFAGASR